MRNDRKKKTRSRHSAPVSLAQLEQGLGYAPDGAKTLERLERPCRVVYVSYRHILLDTEDIYSKYFTDALVSAGLFSDDSPKEVEVTHRQIKIPSDQPEETIIEIYLEEK